nr:cytochrome D1 domain-containing protein [Brucella intermedia]
MKSMNRTAIALSVGILAGLPGAALAQAGHDAHHPGTPPAQAEQAPSPTSPARQMPGMQGMMPEQCRVMMQAMTPECIGAMHQMMQGMMTSPNEQAPHADESLPDFTRAYVESMNEMHGPMMDGVMADDADVAFVRGMIPHHQGAIDMARIVQQYGDDSQTRAWAGQIIAAQEGEIAEMKVWLEANAGEAPAALGQTGGIVYSANEGGNSISTIDLGTGAVDTASIPVAPHNVDLTPDGKLLLAVGNPATEGDHGSDGHGHGAEEGLLVILDPQNITVPKATVAVGSHPAHVVADRLGRAYVSLAGGDEIAVIDLARAEVIGRIATGDYPHGLRLSPDETQLYVANVEDGSMSVIDTQALSEVARIPVGTAPVQVGFTPSGDQVYVSLRDENRVAVIDTSSRQVTNRIDVGRNPIQMFATPDGAYVYVANQGTDAEPNDTVSVIDTATGQIVKTITTGGGAHGVSASADGAYVFVTNIADDSVSIIDVEKQEVVRTVPVGDRPNGIVYGGPTR